MKLKSYIKTAPNTDLTRSVEIRNAADAAPGAGWTLLGDVIHEEGDNASGHQKHPVSHVIYQHVQEQVYLKFGIQDMQRVKIAHAGTFKLLEKVLVDQGENRLGVGFAANIKVTLVPADATTDGVVFAISNTDLVSDIVNNGNGELKFKGVGKGEVFVRVRVKGTSFEQTIPFEFTEEIPPAVPVVSVSLAPTTANLAVGATLQLTPGIVPATASNKKVTYTSADPAKATVSPTGLVTGKAAGVVTIGVTTVDGGKNASSSITVTA